MPSIDNRVFIRSVLLSKFTANAFEGNNIANTHFEGLVFASISITGTIQNHLSEQVY
jgi:hypothetical protein